MSIDAINKRVIHGLNIRGDQRQANVICGGDNPDNYYPTATFTHPSLDSITIDLDPSNRIPDSWLSNVDPTTEELTISAPDDSVRLSMYIDDNGRLEYGLQLNVRPLPSRHSYLFQITGMSQYDFIKNADLSLAYPGGTYEMRNYYGDGLVECYVYNHPDGTTSIQVADMAGGYSLYHKTKINNEYQTGQLLDIPRPRFFAGWDPVTKTGTSSEYGSIDIVVNGDIAAVTITEPSNNWLRNATLPIFVDPTLGYTTIGAGADNQIAGTSMVCNLPSMPEAGTLDSIHVALTSYSDANAKGLLYDDDGAPNNLTATGSAFSTGTAGTGTWFQSNCSSESLSSSAVYNAGFICDGAPFRHYTTSETSYDIYSDASGSYATPADPHAGTIQNADTRMSAYITYSAAGGGVSLYQRSLGRGIGRGIARGL